MNEAEKSKQLVGKEAASFVKDGMKVGLGSGSTAYWMIKELGKRVEQGLTIEGVPTSNKTAEWAKEAGIPLTDFSKVEELDITIDGADEFDPQLHLIKGGGGALLREKVVAAAAERLIIIVDGSKKVTHLGEFPLPIEVVPFGWKLTSNKIAQFGVNPTLRRTNNDEIYVTDNGNYILDCQFGQIDDPTQLHQQLIQQVGVVETGLFVGMTDKVIVGNQGEVEVIDRD